MSLINFFFLKTVHSVVQFKTTLRWLNTVLIPVFQSPFSLKPLILWLPKLATRKLATQTSDF